MFSNKVGSKGKLTLIDEVKVVSEDNEVAETFKSYFENIVEISGLNSKYMSEEPVSNALVTDITKKFQNHPSIIKKWRTIKDILDFQMLN